MKSFAEEVVQAEKKIVSKKGKNLKRCLRTDLFHTLYNWILEDKHAHKKEILYLI